MDTNRIEFKCSICFLEIDNSQVSDPQCDSNFHQNHLAAWLLKNANCPVCRRILPKDLRMDLYPKTKEKRIELEGIRDDFSQFFDRAGMTDKEKWDQLSINYRYVLYVVNIICYIMIWISGSIINDNSVSSSFFWSSIFSFSTMFILLLSVIYFYLFIRYLIKREASWIKMSMAHLLLTIAPFIVIIVVNNYI